MSTETDPDHEGAICKHCRKPIWRRVVPDVGEWAHYPGGIYCRTSNGFTNSDLLTATPMSHPKDGFDEGDYNPLSKYYRMDTFVCKRCMTVTVDRSVHDQHCPAKKELR